MKNLFSLFFILQWLAFSSYSQVYVQAGSTGTGSLASPFGTIQEGINAADNGQTVYVRNGTYSEKVNLKTGVTLEAYLNESPIIDGSGLSPNGREGLIDIIDVNNVVIDGFEVRNFYSSGAPTPVGIYMEGSCANVTIKNNRIHNIENQNQTTSNVGAHGIGVFGTTNNGITNLTITGNEVYDCILQSSEAFVLNGNVDGFKVSNNEVHDNNNIGFDFIGYEGECSCGDNDRVRNGEVNNNIATNNRSDLANPWYQGEASAGGFYVDGGTSIIFDGNLSSGNNLGFEFASEHSGKSTSNIIVRNSVIYNNTEVGITIGGYASGLGASDDITIVNNTLYKNRGWGTELIFQHNIHRAIVKNNIFYADNTDCYEETGQGNSENTFGNNLYFNGQAGPGSVSTLDPTFSNPSNNDFALQVSSPAVDAGENLNTTITGSLDFTGANRISGATIDLGAYEYGSIISTDPPSTPTNFTITNTSSSSISLSWSSSTGASEYDVERSLSQTGPFTNVFNGSILNQTDQNLDELTTYYYRLRATNQYGESDWTTTINGTTTETGNVTIVVDGDINDWSNVTSISTNGQGGLTSLKCAADETDVFFLVEGTIDANYILFLDQDSNSSTGMQSNLWSPEGSDYNIENGDLYVYTGNGTTWAWNTSSDATVLAEKTSSFIELSISRNLFNGVNSIGVGVDIESSAWETVGTIPTINSPIATCDISNVVTSSITELNLSNELLILTGGNNDYTILLKNPTESVLDIVIFDLNGRRVQPISQSKIGLSSAKITLPSFANGLHIVTVTTNQNTYVQRFLVE